MENANDFETLIQMKKENQLLAEEEQINYASFNRALPVSLQCIDSTRCNLSCVMCEWHRSAEIRKQKHAQELLLPKSLLENVFNELFPTLSYYCPTKMGEPLLSPHFGWSLDWMNRYGVKMDLITNGILLTPQMIEKIIPITHNLTISMDSCKKQTLEKIRRGIKYEILLQNIQNVIAFRNSFQREHPEWEATKIIVHSVLMKSNLEELPESVNFCYELGVDTFEAYHIYVFDKVYADESLMFHKERTNEILDEAKQCAKMLGLPIGFAKKFWLGDGESPQIEFKPCPWVYKYALIEYDGTVRSCAVPNHPMMGDLHKQSFKEIWNNEIYQEFRRQINTNDPPEICKDCGERMHYIGDFVPYEESRFLKY